jgi:hypothetical protein
VIDQALRGRSLWWAGLVALVCASQPAAAAQRAPSIDADQCEGIAARHERLRDLLSLIERLPAAAIEVRDRTIT